jgi:hypothetical protein
MTETVQQYTARLAGLVGDREPLAVMGETPGRLQADPARLRHAGMHAERGRESVEHLTRMYAGHDLNHLAQIERLLTEAKPRHP